MGRLIEHLTTKAGLLKIQDCIANSVPCHGNASADTGIPECRALYAELERCKAGGLPPPMVQPDLTLPPSQEGGQDPSSGGADPTGGADRVVALAEERLMVTLADEKSDLPDGVTQREYELFLKAKAYMEVTFAKDANDFKDSVATLMQRGRIVHVQWGLWNRG